MKARPMAMNAISPITSVVRASTSDAVASR
jgi:hypothetical protein